MANITYPYADPGIAAFDQLDTYLQNFLIMGSHPELSAAYSYPLPNSVTYAQFTVVGLDGAGKLIPAVSGVTAPIGVLASASALGAAGTGTGPVWYSGAFNMDALVWDASYATDALKEAAFRGSPTPTTIVIAKRP